VERLVEEAIGDGNVSVWREHNLESPFVGSRNRLEGGHNGRSREHRNVIDRDRTKAPMYLGRMLWMRDAEVLGTMPET
jgi:hypothetical protein